ncbi:MAG: biopolymer transporter ExbD [Planctomycetes bacterium]|nr:biopolymer transporter ExbD [Planctomycetota bacterium]
MRFTRSPRSNRTLVLEMAPMIDVVFLLIVFFMTVARFAQESRVELDLPQEAGEQSDITEEAGLIVNIDGTGAMIVGDETIDLERLEELVRGKISRLPGRNAEQLKLLLRADRNADTSRINQVINRLQAIGVGAARIATDPRGS